MLEDRAAGATATAETGYVWEKTTDILQQISRRQTVINEILIAIIGGGFGLLGTVLSIWASITANTVRREMQVKILEPQLEAYRQLWSLMDVASPSLDKEFTPDERKSLEGKLRAWYYEGGNGIFLSLESRGLLVQAKEYLLNSEKASSEIRKKLSELRSQMKNDIGVYGTEDVTSPQKI
jgi:hypothetical protein